jgi:hypothetical protein
MGHLKYPGKNIKFLQTSENENTICHNLWDRTSFLRREFIDIGANIKKTQRDLN